MPDPVLEIRGSPVIQTLGYGEGGSVSPPKINLCKNRGFFFTFIRFALNYDSVIFLYVLSDYIIHSKYFPDSDWLTAHV